MLTEDFTIVLKLPFVQQHKKNVYQNIKSPFIKRCYKLLYVNWGVVFVWLLGHTPAHQTSESRSGLRRGLYQQPC